MENSRRKHDILTDILTVKNGKDYDNTKVYTFWGVVAMLCLQAVAVVINHQEFNATAFGIGFGSVVGLGAYGTSKKADTEPCGEPDRDDK